MQVPIYFEFSLAGGWCALACRGGWTCLFANDFDRLKVQVYADNWAHQEIPEDNIYRSESGGPVSPR